MASIHNDSQICTPFFFLITYIWVTGGIDLWATNENYLVNVFHKKGSHWSEREKSINLDHEEVYAKSPTIFAHQTVHNCL